MQSNKVFFLFKAKDLENDWTGWVLLASYTFQGSFINVLGVVLGYFPDLYHPPLEARGEATSTH